MFSVLKLTEKELPDPEWEQSRDIKEKERALLLKNNRAHFPQHFSYAQLGQLGHYFVQPHDIPDFYLRRIEHPICFTNWTIDNIVKEADLLDCESPMASHCRAILEQFKILLNQYKTSEPQRVFSAAVYYHEVHCFTKGQ